MGATRKRGAALVLATAAVAAAAAVILAGCGGGGTPGPGSTPAPTPTSPASSAATVAVRGRIVDGNLSTTTGVAGVTLSVGGVSAVSGSGGDFVLNLPVGVGGDVSVTPPAGTEFRQGVFPASGTGAACGPINTFSLAPVTAGGQINLGNVTVYPKATSVTPPPLCL